MRFLNTKLSREITIDNIDTVLEQSDSTNLMSKFYRNQKASTSEAPETLYENEAWAPKNETIGIFRKRRMNVE